MGLVQTGLHKPTPLAALRLFSHRATFQELWLICLLQPLFRATSVVRRLGTHVTKLREMARKGKDTGWASQLAQCHIHAIARRVAVQSGSESQIQSSGGRKEREIGSNHSRHAQTDHLRKCAPRDQRKWCERYVNRDSYWL